MFLADAIGGMQRGAGRRHQAFHAGRGDAAAHQAQIGEISAVADHAQADVDPVTGQGLFQPGLVSRAQAVEEGLAAHLGLAEIEGGDIAGQAQAVGGHVTGKGNSAGGADPGFKPGFGHGRGSLARMAKRSWSRHSPAMLR